MKKQKRFQVRSCAAIAAAAMMSISIFCCADAKNMTEEENNMGVFNVYSYGAVGDAEADDSPAIQAAIDACAKAGGGTVSMPYGVFLMKSGVKVPAGVTVQGSTNPSSGPWFGPTASERLPFEFGAYVPVAGDPDSYIQRRLFKGTWVIADHGNGTVNDAPTFLVTGGNSAISYIGFVDKGQAPVSAEPTPRPPLIGVYWNDKYTYDDRGVLISDITLSNCYYGIVIASGTDLNDSYAGKAAPKTNLGPVVIRDVMGGPTYRGIVVKGISDPVTVRDIQFNFCDYGSPYNKHRVNNTVDYEFSCVQDLTVSNILSFASDVGMRFGNAYDGVSHITAVNLNLESRIPLQVETAGIIDVTNCYFLSHTGLNLTTGSVFACITADPPVAAGGLKLTLKAINTQNIGDGKDATTCALDLKLNNNSDHYQFTSVGLDSGTHAAGVVVMRGRASGKIEFLNCRSGSASAIVSTADGALPSRVTFIGSIFSNTVGLTPGVKLVTCKIQGAIPRLVNQ